ncbi:MAG: heavy-metal-associated domain-containing protein [Vulcanimicrobiaceae bacterium]|jgi:copper chaperone CopZ
MKQTLSITGMTCNNCVRHVTEALRELPGVRDATVDLTSASATIEADREIPRDEIARALDDAGYALA